MSIDYTKANLVFKLKKLFRYIRLYGINRTLIKVKGHYHMKSTDKFTGEKWINESCKTPNSKNRHVAIIGCGNFSFSNIAYYLAKNNKQFLRAALDINNCMSLSLCKEYGGLYASSNFQDILDDKKITMVFIASNHASHAEYAKACIEAGKDVHIEKPHVVTKQQLDLLSGAITKNPKSKVFLGFNRPRTVLFKKLQSLLNYQSGPLMINWFIAGHEISDDHWYFDEKEGGRVLGNLCHWTDLTLHLISLEKAFPCVIIPATHQGAKSDFVVSIMFADQSSASITFSAKGQAFEGVKETLIIHKGDLLANLSDFHSFTANLIEKKIKYKLFFRNHGHQENIVHSIINSLDSNGKGEDINYVRATAIFFLAIREAIDSGKKVIVSPDDIIMQ